jgi:molecular chaperone GrpE
MEEERQDRTSYPEEGQNIKPGNADTEPMDSNATATVENSMGEDMSDIKSKMLLLQADFDNFRKRVARDRDDYQKFACAVLMGELLPVLDIFEIGLKSVDQANPMVSGFAMAFNQLKSVLGSSGLTEVLPDGEHFDPTLHEAVAHIPSDEVPADKVIEVARTGYMLNGKLLRPAAVVVSSGKLEQK